VGAESMSTPTAATGGNGATAADGGMLGRALASAKAGTEKATAVALAGREKVTTLHRDEPVALVNLLRFGLLLSCLSWKMAPMAMISTMAAGEAVFTKWQRSQVSPRRSPADRRHPPSTE